MLVLLAQAGTTPPPAEPNFEKFIIWALLAAIAVAVFFARGQLAALVKGVSETGEKASAAVAKIDQHSLELARLTIGIEATGKKIDDAVTTINGHTTKLELLEFRVQILEREKAPFRGP